jgi:DNA-binding winged helix-turn-helix (wHTH) protein
MPPPQAGPGARTIRFDAFELDLASGELRKSGARIRLQEQPFQVLASLLEHPGVLMTREELRRKLWPGDTFVDFDHSLNTAVNKIREALGDAASSPRFVETIARRGYRFIGTVQDSSGASAGSVPGHATGEAFDAALNIPLPHRAIPRALFALIQIMYLVFYLEALFHWRGVDSTSGRYLPATAALSVLVLVFVTSAIGIALRCYLISAVSFDYRYLRRDFERLFLGVLVLDVLWGLAPFLAAARLGLGAAVAATAALLYVPFAERTLLRMAYRATS